MNMSNDKNRHKIENWWESMIAFIDRGGKKNKIKKQIENEIENSKNF